MTRKVLIIILIAILIYAFAAFIVKFFFFKSGKSLSQRTMQTVPTNTSRVVGSTISLSSSSKVVQVGQSIPVSVFLTAERLQAIDVVLTYDPKLVKVQNLQGVNPDLTLLQQKNENGRLRTSFSINPSSTEDTISGNIFSFDVVGVAAGSTSIAFDPKETIVAREGKNVLSAAVDLQLQVFK